MTENFVKIYYSFLEKEETPDMRSEYIVNVDELPRIVDVKPNNIPALVWIAEHLLKHEIETLNNDQFSDYYDAMFVYLWDQEQNYLGCVDVEIRHVRRFLGTYVKESDIGDT